MVTALLVIWEIIFGFPLRESPFMFLRI